MTDARPGPDETPDVVVTRRSRMPSVVWLIPLVAAGFAGWLWWRALAEAGPTVTIHFETAEGLEAGKTPIKHRDVELGQVLEIALRDDLSGVRVTAELSPQIEPYLRDGTRFWVVRPRVGAGGVSGLQTLLSGPYIELDPGESGASRRHFDGLESPPVAPADAPGLVVVLRAERLGSLSIGSVVEYRSIAIGRVQRHGLVDEGRGVEIEAYIDAEHASLIRDNSLFWDASGVSASLTARGVEVETGSLESILTGGIACETPEGEAPGARIESGHVFTLHADHDAAHDTFERGDRYVMYFEGSVRGLSPGAPVEFRGIQIGEVAEITASFDRESFEFHIPVFVDIQPERIERMAGRDPDDGIVLDALVERGLRAQLAPGNLVTGALFVDLDFRPETEAHFHARDETPEIPTIPSAVDQLQDTIRQLPQIARQARDAVQGVERMINSPGTDELIADVRETVDDLRGLVASVDERAPAVLDGLERTLATLDATLVKARRALDGLEAATADGAALRRKVDEALSDASDAARALRQLAETLERQPEALLQGKSP